MKKSISVILTAFIFFVSCHKDSDDSTELNDDSFSVEEAKEWFNANNSPIMVLNTENLELHSKSQKRNPIVFQNKWNHSFKSRKGSLHVVEVAMRSQGRFGMATQEAMDKYRETGNKGYITSLSRLVILKDRKEETTQSVIMTMFGDVDYLEKKNFELWSNTYLQKDKDFAGMVYFHTTDGEFMNAWRLKDGKVVGRVTEKTKGSGVAASQSCTTTLIYTTYEQCMDWYNLGEVTSYNGTTCEVWTEYSGTYTECETTDNPPPNPDNNSSGGGSGSSNHSMYSAATLVALSPETPIDNILEFLDCFNTSNNAVLTVYADQPVEGSSAPISITGDVGHAFISITQNGKTATFGFYPEGDGIKSISGPSVLGNNGNYHYDISVTKTITGSTLSQVLDKAISYPSQYHVEYYNCTNYARDIGNIAGMNIPSAWGVYPGVQSGYTGSGGGQNPGKLGEVMRGMDGQNGVTVNDIGGTSPLPGQGCN